MKTADLFSLERQFHFYKSYHNNTINRRIHIVFVPIIFVSALSLLSEIPLSYPFTDVSRLFTLVYVFYCIFLNFNLGLLFTPFILGAYALSQAFCKYAGPSGTVPWAFTLNFAGWVAQFVGHFAFEGKSPALMDSFAQSILAAPIVIWLEVLFSLGFLSGTKAWLIRSRVVAKARKAVEKVE